MGKFCDGVGMDFGCAIFGPELAARGVGKNLGLGNFWGFWCGACLVILWLRWFGIGEFCIKVYYTR